MGVGYFLFLPFIYLAGGLRLFLSFSPLSLAGQTYQNTFPLYIIGIRATGALGVHVASPIISLQPYSPPKVEQTESDAQATCDYSRLGKGRVKAHLCDLMF